MKIQSEENRINTKWKYLYTRIIEMIVKDFFPTPEWVHVVCSQRKPYYSLFHSICLYYITNTSVPNGYVGVG